jgi:hypothetical protein
MANEAEALVRFRAAYERLSRDGHCDAPGGMEYRRVWEEYRRVWEEYRSAGCPEDVENFIRRRANALPFPPDLN